MKRETQPFLVSALLVLGFGGIVAQALLLRELLVLFCGNELSLGLIIGAWVVSEALGALVGGIWAERKSVNPKTYAYAMLLFSAALPASIYLVRTFKTLVGIPAEMAVSIFTVLYASFALLLPTGFLHGFLFSLACSLYARLTGTAVSSAGKVYFYETLGTIAGGLAISYLLLPHLHAFQIAFGVVVLNGLSCLCLLSRFRAERATSVLTVTAILSVVLPAVLLVRGAGSLQAISIKKAFPGRNLVYYENSFYQNIAVVKTEDQYTFLTDGLPAITTPVPDIVSVEEFIHFSLLALPHPENILCLSGGAGGAIHEVLKYPSVKRIDYVELDPELLRTIGLFDTPLTRSELADPRVHVHYVDGRRFVRESTSRYDAILLGLQSPSNLQKNRFYTQEFFLLAKRLLKQDAIFSFTLPGSLAYYTPELKAVNGSVLQSLSEAFPYTYVIPGDTNIFLASPSPEITRITPGLLYRRLETAGIQTMLITLPHLTDRFQQRKRDWFFATLTDVRTSSNRDFHPTAVFQEIAYENLMLTPFLKTIFEQAQRASLPASLIVIGLVLVILFLVGKSSARVALPFAITTTGFAGMATELMLIFGFQVVYGYVFYEIAILITAFMAGIAGGSLFITSLRRVRKLLRLFISIEGCFVLFVLSLLALFFFLETSALSRPLAIHLLFLLLLFTSGIFTGMEFPLATTMYQRAYSLERSVGVLYAADLAGGWLGGLATGFLLFPVLGIYSTCLLVALLKAGSFAFLLSQRKRGIIHTDSV